MSDDLDAFFEEVEEVAVVEDEKGAEPSRQIPSIGSSSKSASDHVDDVAPPPTKKAKRVVVAASAAAEPTVKVAPSPRYTAPSMMSMIPSPPPPPPPLPSTKAKQHVDVPTFTLFVGNLDPVVSDAELHQHFSKYESLVDATVVRNPKTNNSKEFGFVNFTNALDAGQAIRTLHQSWLGSRPIKVQRYTKKNTEAKLQKKK